MARYVKIDIKFRLFIIKNTIVFKSKIKNQNFCQIEGNKQQSALLSKFEMLKSNPVGKSKHREPSPIESNECSFGPPKL